MSDLVGIEADQPHEGFIAEQQGGQGIYTLDATQGLQAIEQHILHAGPHLALNRCAPNQRDQPEDAQFLQELEELIQQGPFVQAIEAIDDLLPVQTASNPCAVAPSGLPTPLLRQVLSDRFACWQHRPPPSPACFSAIEESGLSIKSSAYLGTSVRNYLIIMPFLTISSGYLIRQNFSTNLLFLDSPHTTTQISEILSCCWVILPHRRSIFLRCRPTPGTPHALTVESLI
jgi:hypothetical protein